MSSARPARTLARILRSASFRLPLIYAVMFMVSAGAACSSGKVGASHVLTAMGEGLRLRQVLGQSAFAGAIRTKDADDLAASCSQLKLIQYLSATIALRKACQRQLDSHQIHVTRAEPFQPTSEGRIEP